MKNFHFLAPSAAARSRMGRTASGPPPECSIGVEVIDDTPGLADNRIPFDCHSMELAAEQR